MLLPRAFRTTYGSEMEDVFAERCRGVKRAALCVLTAREVGAVMIAALRVRMDHPAHLHNAMAAGAAMTIVALSLTLHDGGLRPVLPLAAGDSIDFTATDPAGEFTLSIRGGRAVAATLDHVTLPAERLVHRGDSIRFLAPGGAVVLAVAYDRAQARIEWDARPPTCRGQAIKCVRQ